MRNILSFLGLLPSAPVHPLKAGPHKGWLPFPVCGHDHLIAGSLQISGILIGFGGVVGLSGRENPAE